MLKRDITYKDFNDQEVTETFYFNLTRTEIVELEFSYQGGLEATLKKIIETEDVKAIIQEFKKIVLMAYGVKSEDGKRFIKSEEIRQAFSQTAAYDALFMELATSDDAAAAFVKGIIPSDMSVGLATTDVALPPMPPSETK